MSNEQTLSGSWKTKEVSDNTSFEEIDRLFALQRTHRQQVKNSSVSDRIKKLKKFKKALLDNRDLIQQALADDLRRPKPETDLVEIFPVKAEIDHAIAHIREWMEPEKVDTPLAHLGTSSEVVFEPKGVTLNIAPWNYPFQLAMIPVISSVAAGCTMIIKPSEFTPFTNVVIRKVIGEVFNEKEYAVVEGDVTVSQHLLQKKFDHIYFTGSPAVGKIVMRYASENLTSVTLELGGKSPAIIDETANANEAAKKIAWGKFINCGQTCIAPDYVMVHESKKQEFVEAFKKQVQSFYGETDEAIQQSPDLTRIVNDKHFVRVRRLIEDAVNNGATVAFGGKTDEKDLYVAPTLLTDVPLDAMVLEEEIFGPVLPVVSWSDPGEVIESVDGKEKPLALYIFSRKKKNKDFWLNNTTAGGTCINDTLLHNGQCNLPFGGVNNSGIGKGHGKWGFMEFTNARAVYKQHLTNGAAQGMYPPYNSTKQTMIDLTLNWL